LTGPLERMTGIAGAPPDLASPPAGCRFHPRCPHCVDEESPLHTLQTTVRPLLHDVGPAHRVACHLVKQRT
jgi:peptide/nickel transport system ATP-binding protein